MLNGRKRERLIGEIYILHLHFRVISLQSNFKTRGQAEISQRKGVDGDEKMTGDSVLGLSTLGKEEQRNVRHSN